MKTNRIDFKRKKYYMNYNKTVLGLIFISFNSFAMEISNSIPRQVQVRSLSGNIQSVGSFSEQVREVLPIAVQASKQQLFSLTCVPVQENSDVTHNVVGYRSFSRAQQAKIVPLVFANQLNHEHQSVWGYGRVHPLVVEGHEVTQQTSLGGHVIVRPYHDSFANSVIQQENLCCSCFAD